MPEEPLKEGEGAPTPAPEGTPPEAQEPKPGEPTPGEPKPSEPKPQEPQPGLDNRVAELQSQVGEFKKQIEDSKERIEKAEFTIQKGKEKLKEYRERLAEHGLLEEGEEEEERISSEQIKESISEAMKPIVGKITQLETTLGEIARAQQAKKDAGKPGPGAAGQQPPPKKKMPSLNAEERKIIAKANLHWDESKEAFVSADGKRTYKLGETKGVEIPKAQE
jgi:peptidoglycan hydrolase CwlO-like protein